MTNMSGNSTSRDPPYVIDEITFSNATSMHLAGPDLCYLGLSISGVYTEIVILPSDMRIHIDRGPSITYEYSPMGLRIMMQLHKCYISARLVRHGSRLFAQKPTLYLYRQRSRY